MAKEYFTTDIARHIWETKYRYREGDEIIDETIEDTWWRVAKALASVEEDREGWGRRFYEALEGFKFLPGGRIQAGAGTRLQVTLFNCFVMGIIEDSMESIFDNLKEGAITMQQGGGVGYDFSTLRPRGTRARGVGAIASGPVSFMDIWDAMCATILSTGARRGAMMGTLRCDHPDIEEFIHAKETPGRLSRFNLSVLVTDAFMEAIDRDEDWPLVFPAESIDGRGEIVYRRWPGKEGEVPCLVLRRMRARDLWEQIMRATYDHAEPGVLFIDRINQLNNLYYREYITATNPCGEVPLPPYGSCDLGSVNLTQFVRAPFSEKAHLDMAGIEATVEVGVRMLDNVIDVSHYPLDKQRAYEQGARRIGLGITGLADTLIMLGHTYGSEASLKLAREVMERICEAAYRTSIALAKEKGTFPFLDREAYLRGRFVSGLSGDIRAGIARDGMRNSHLLAIAPTGTISLLANNVSSSLEPVFDFRYERRVLNEDGSASTFILEDYAYRLWRELKGDASLPPTFVRAQDLPPEVHLAMQAALQPCVDNSISKTINIPEDYPFEDFKDVYRIAYEKGLKGCTTFRPNPITGEVLRGAEAGVQAPHCCTLEREGD